MSDEAALRQAVLASPAEDLPRLVYADWLDDCGHTERAEFIRAQVEYAATPPWEPFAVRLRHRRPDLVSGGMHWLPHLGDFAEWYALRRGFGWSVLVRQLGAFLAGAHSLFAIEPIGELILPAAARDDWEMLAAEPWLAKVTSLRFRTGSMLSEPIRALAASPFSNGIRRIAFDVSTSPGMGAVVELLALSPLISQLTELEFRLGHDRDGEILEELNKAPNLKLERLTLATMGQTPEAFAHLANLPNPEYLKSLAIQHQPASGAVAAALRGGLQSFPLQQFMVLAGQLTGRDVQGFAERAVDSIQSLNLNENIFGEEGLTSLCEQPKFAAIRSLHLARCGLEDDTLKQITEASFWPNLVELDVSGNRFTDAIVDVLLAATSPPDLVALVLTGMAFNEETRQRLRERFGEAAILDD